MSVYSLYFSPTGGTKKVLDILTDELSVDVQIDLSERGDDYGAYHFDKEDVCIIGVPSFGGRVPGVALERMKQMQVEGALAVVLVVFGNRAYDDTLLELKNEANACGFTVAAAIAAVAEHSIMRQFGEGRPDNNDEEILRNYANALKELIAHKEKARDFQVPGNKPYKAYGGVPLKPKANKSCIRCGRCSEKCPVGAIPGDNPSSLNGSKCVSCMRCIAICPQHARKLKKVVLFVISQIINIKKAFVSRKANELYL
jgi:ferredoxin